MTAKSKPSKAVIDPAKEKEAAMQHANFALSPSLNAALLAQSFSIHRDVGLGGLLQVIGDQCTNVHGCDLKRAESMLIAQAHSLDVMFASLARRAAMNMGEYMGAAETYLKLALKAQSQCRATLETLAAIKNPSVVFANQANIAHGPQQVNNGMPAPIAHAEQTKKPQTELLEHDDGTQRLVTGTASETSGSDQVVEAVAAVHRPAQQRREGHRQS